MNIKHTLCIFALSVLSVLGANASRQVVSLDGEWSFIDPESGTTTVQVPHSWEKFEANKQAFQLIKTCTYEKTIDVSSYAGKRLLLNFEGVNKVATIKVDGVQVGKHDGGFSAFYVDITDACEGKSQVTVSVATTNISINTMPVNSDFTHWAGIYRDVNLVVVEPEASFSNMDFGSEGLYVASTVDAASKTVTVTPTVALDENCSGKTLSIVTTVKDASGNKVASTSKEVTAGDDVQASILAMDAMTINNATLWNGTKNPYLYTVTSTLSVDGVQVDEVSQKVGFRTYEVKDGKFYLNGELYQLHGVGMHQERNAATNVSTDEERAEDINTVLEMGANAIRTCHYPHNQQLYDLCDEKGIVCWCEVPFYLMMLETETFKSNCTQCVKEMVKQGYNHPSIIVWGIENEVNYYSAYAAIYARMGLPEATVEQIGAYMKELAATVKEIDPSRLIGEAEIDNTAYAQETAGWTTKESGINTVGFNIYTGWYSNVNGATQDNKANRIETSLKNKVAKYQGYFNTSSDNTTSYVMTEYGAGANVMQHADLGEDFQWGGTDATKGYVTTGSFQPEEYQSYVHEGMIMALYGDETNNVTPVSNVWCAFAWSMFDFSCYRNEGGTTRLNTKGLITADRKTKKDAFYLYKANWNKTDYFVHICSSRYTERAKSTVEVKVYSNCENVELQVNDKNLGKGTKVQDGVFVWENVILAATDNVVTASGSDKDGNVLGTDVCDSWVTGIGFTDVTMSYDKAFYYDGIELPAVTVSNNGKTLTENTDYTLTWNKTEISDPADQVTPQYPEYPNYPNYGDDPEALKSDVYTATITGIGEYSGTTTKQITIIEQPEYPATTFNDAGYSTYSSAYAFVINSTDVTAYKATVDGESIVLTPLQGYIPAGTGVILYRSTTGASADITVPTVSIAAADMTDNSLLPTTTATEAVIDKSTVSGTIWALGNEDKFLKYTGASFIANRAYLVHEKSSDAKAMTIVFDNATAVNSVNADLNANGAIYNLAGQRVSKAANGIYIKYGKKFVNK